MCILKQSALSCRAQTSPHSCPLGIISLFLMNCTERCMYPPHQQIAIWIQQGMSHKLCAPWAFDKLIDVWVEANWCRAHTIQRDTIHYWLMFSGGWTVAYLEHHTSVYTTEHFPLYCSLFISHLDCLWDSLPSATAPFPYAWLDQARHTSDM